MGLFGSNRRTSATSSVAVTAQTAAAVRDSAAATAKWKRDMVRRGVQSHARQGQDK